MLEELKREAYEANLALPAQGLINLTFGNASAIDRAAGIFAIKPSGVAYADLKPEDMVLIDLAGNQVEGTMRPSSDSPTHRRLYLALPEIRGIVHTHSTDSHFRRKLAPCRWNSMSKDPYPFFTARPACG